MGRTNAACNYMPPASVAARPHRESGINIFNKNMALPRGLGTRAKQLEKRVELHRTFVIIGHGAQLLADVTLIEGSRCRFTSSNALSTVLPSLLPQTVGACSLPISTWWRGRQGNAADRHVRPRKGAAIGPRVLHTPYIALADAASPCAAGGRTRGSSHHRLSGSPICPQRPARAGRWGQAWSCRQGRSLRIRDSCRGCA